MAHSADGAPVVLKDKYELQRELGAGGMGTVYLARHRLLHQQVAVKVLTAQAMETPVAIERFLREARALASVRHPAVCQVFDVDTNDDGMPFIVMEYLEGKTLDQVIKGAPHTPLAERVRWVIEAAKGLAAAHAVGIVHRDVKPANLMLSGPKPGVVKVLDFGVAKRKEDHGQALTGDAAVGTVKYMSPEQLMGEPVDARSDVWSLAVTLYQLVARQLPFDGETIGAYVHAVISVPPHPLSQRGVEVPPALWDALENALKPLEHRTRDLQTFVKELEAGLRKPSQARPTVPARAAVMPPKRSSLGLIVGLSVAFVALVAAAVIGLQRGDAPREPAPVPVPVVIEKPTVEKPVEKPPEPPPVVVKPDVVEAPPTPVAVTTPPPVTPKVAKPKTPVAAPKSEKPPEEKNPDHL